MHGSRTNSGRYIGRYAPSPTGRLHLGNLMAAALSWADARVHGGIFRLRIEDLDTPRNVAGSSESILRDLEALGLDWDGPVVYQSDRIDLYEAALKGLIDRGLAFPCRCSRREIREALGRVERWGGGEVYPGTCRGRALDPTIPGVDLSWRFHIPEGHGNQRVVDRRMGAWEEDVAAKVGDYVLKRKDRIMAYQLACVVDDIEMGMTDIVRGEDLASSCPRQQCLMGALGGATPRWLHLPLVLRPDGEKISKRHRRWDDTQVNGPKTLGVIASTLNWAPEGVVLKAMEFRELYASQGWRLPKEGDPQ